MKPVRLLAALAAISAAYAQEKPTLYVVPYAHLDTQWRWSYPQTIREFLWNTMERNFALFDKYPGYTFNFGGSRRFEMMKEYFPGEYTKVVAAVKGGRWFPAPASVDETEVNVISGESVIRNVLYGNEYYRREFGVESEEFMRPDSFGFPYALPTLLKHAGLLGFSTQKLSWGSAVGVPFNVGLWEGPDGSAILSALNPTSYGSHLDGDLTHDPYWIDRLQKDPVPVDYRYYGTGDVGGAPDENSVKWGEASVMGDGPIRVVQSGADAMFKALTPGQIAKLPRYKGELLLTQHSAGSLTSHAEMKRWNRQSELLADFAERASVAASLWAQTPYPKERLNKAWDIALGSQMHDILPGTCLPKAYEYAQNDELLVHKEFAAVASDAVGRVAAGMDTRAKGTPLVVFNPLAIVRRDVVEAWVPKPEAGMENVYGPDGKLVPTQIVETAGDRIKIIFLARVSPNGFAVYDARSGSRWLSPGKEAQAYDGPLENERFRVTLNAAGDIASIYDKVAKRESLKAPARLDLQHENPDDWPAWNMDWKDQKLPPYAHVDGPAKIRIVENGPVRSTIEVERESNGSTYKTRVSLTQGGDRVEIEQGIDWRTKETALKAAFPLVTANAKATYGMAVGAIERGNNNEKAYEVPVHGWMDLTAPDGSYGVGVLTPFKYGADKPSDDLLRLTLLYTPGVHGGYQDQGVQDFGRHSIVYALAPHAGDWRKGNVPWNAARLAQPLRAFTTTAHPGRLGKTLSLLSTSSPQVDVQAIKEAEDGNGFIVRLRELTGKPASNVVLKMANSIVTAEEVDGQERPLGKAVLKNGALVVDVKGYGLRAYRIGVATTRIALPQPVSTPVALTPDLDVASTDKNDADGAFVLGKSYPAEMLPAQLDVDGVRFKMGPTVDGAKNAVVARGQTISLPKGSNRVYLLAAATQDVQADFHFGSAVYRRAVPAWDGYVGQWDTRLWAGVQPESAYSWRLPFVGLAPGYVKAPEVAWYASHRHLAGKGNDYYQYAYLFKLDFVVPKGTTSLTLPNDPRVRIFAVSATRGNADRTRPAMPLYETLDGHVASGAPTISFEKDPQGNGGTVTIKPPLYGRTDKIRYAVNGGSPTTYEGPFALVKTATVRAWLGGPVGTARIETSDRVAPKIESVQVSRELGIGTATFSEPVDRTVAEQVANYGGITPTSVTLSPDGRTVQFTFDALPQGEIRVSAPGVTDLAGNRVDSSVVATMLAPVFTAPTTLQTATFDSAAPKGAKEPWTINLWLMVDRQPEDRSIIAGFGRARDGEEGRGRYFTKFRDGINFWIASQDVRTQVPLDLKAWQMLTAAYDGTTVRLYKNGQPIGSGTPALQADSSKVNLLPLDAWDGKRKVEGEVRGFTIWSQALPPNAVQRLFTAGQG
ncbi:hypothetical protein BH11ARM2_BH11ARM2_06680 [soil metagenome]